MVAGRNTDISILGFDCLTAAGFGADALWKTLQSGADQGRDGVCGADWPSGSYEDGFVSVFEKLWKSLSLSSSPNQNWGFIFASTKGTVEDFVWQDFSQKQDPFQSVLHRLPAVTGVSPVRHAVVSNACASAHGAMYLASRWLELSLVTHVAIFAADRSGPFVEKGFRCLNALTTTKNRPFTATRDGLQLGDAAAILVLSNVEQSDLQLSGVAIESEGYAVTRPSPSAESLKSILSQVMGTQVPDVVLAHGTGTLQNDFVEDQALCQFFENTTKPLVLATKWCVGHSLGASGAVDSIVACEMLRRGQAFSFPAGAAADPKLGAHYGFGQEGLTAKPLQVLTQSLGFGGVQGAALIQKRGVR